MNRSRANQWILIVLMGIIWALLFVSQIRMTKRVFYSTREIFQSKLDVAVIQSFNTLDKMAFRTFFSGKRFKEWYRKINALERTEDLQIPLDSSFQFLYHLEGMREKMGFLSSLIAETHSSFDYGLLGYNAIDSVLSVCLHDNYIYDPVKIGLYSAKEKDFFFISSDVNANEMKEHGFSYSILSIDMDGQIHSDSLYLYFPALHSRFHWDLVYSYIVIALLLLVLLYCFIVFSVIVNRQRKINEFRVQMLHSITHELKTPITTISLAVQLLQDKSIQKDETSSEEYLTMISDETSSMLTMIDEVLTIFRSRKMPRKDLEDVEIHSLLKNVIESQKLRLDECKAKVHFDFQAERDLILGDPIHLSNGFSNLVDNAIKYRDGDLVIDISTRVVGRKIEIRFSDNGIGIAEENQQLIFEPFTRVNVDNKHYIKGYGLGLNYFLQIIKYHKGSIKVESELSKGTTFFVYLPLKL